MNSNEIEQKFNILWLVLLQGNVTAARRIFDMTLKKAVDGILDQAIQIAIAKGAFSSIEDIHNLKYLDY